MSRSKNAGQRVTGDMAPRKRKEEVNRETDYLFRGVKACMVWDGGISWKKYQRFVDQFQERGGDLQTVVGPTTTHIISSKWSTIVKEICLCEKCPERVKDTKHCVHWDWLTAAMLSNLMVDEYDFLLARNGSLPGTLARWKESNGKWDSALKWQYTGGPFVEMWLSREKAKLEGGSTSGV